METIILAGGFGKRLSRILNDIPKPMAPVNNRPFLDYVLDYLINNGVNSVIISVYYKYNVIINHYKDIYKGLNITYSIDTEVLGTGGAIKEALIKSNNDQVFIVNGDTYFNVNLSNLLNYHLDKNNDITFSLKSMTNFNRYGSVETNSSGQVLSLKEKDDCDYGKVDGGVYVVNRTIFNSWKREKEFSFYDFMKKNLNNLNVGSLLNDEIFIDIGTPEDYEKAQNILNHI